MVRRYRDQTFRKADFVRAYKAALAAGMKDPRIEIDLTRRRLTVRPTALGESKPADEELDRELAKFIEARHGEG
jgi:hypothetical protein